MVVKKTNALDGLISKLDEQLNQEKRKFSRSKSVGEALGAGVLGGIGVAQVKVNEVGGAFGGTPTLRQDPLDMKSRMKRTQRRRARRSNIMTRHNVVDTVEEVDEVDIDEDLKENLDFIDENKFKTMDWTEPDGSKTTLKFDENGTLIGKVKTKTKRKSRPEKFSRDLKRAVDLNAQSIEDFNAQSKAYRAMQRVSGDEI